VTDQSPGVLIGIPDIARIARVGRSAVGNWRKRYPDFPTSRVQAPSGALFDLTEVERWLIEKGKIEGPVPRSVVLWRIADALRGVWSTDQLGRFLVASLVYLEACDRAADGADARTGGLRIAPSDRWGAVRQTSSDDLMRSLLDACQRIERGNTELTGLVCDGLDQSPPPDADLLRSLFDTIEEAAADEDDDPRHSMFYDVASLLERTDRFRGEFTTPEDLSYLLVRLGDCPGGTVFDPAVGEGGLLQLAALAETHDQAQDMRLVGYDVNDDVLRFARSWMFVSDIPADLRLGNVFRVPVEKLPRADLVLIDPPLGQRDWGDADVYLDKRWSFGVPPPSNGDLAWLQLAVQCLAPEGRAVVLTPSATTSRGGREAEIRRAMLEAGVIDAVILLAPRLRPNTSIPLTVWLLRSPASRRSHSVLLFDASSFSERGRSESLLPQENIDLIVNVVKAYRTSGRVPDAVSEFAWAVPVEDVAVMDANLDPIRHRPIAEATVDELEQRAKELRSALRAGSEQAGSAVRALVDALEGVDRP
jgi:type I restriction-modification system DNA methylase subunit